MDIENYRRYLVSLFSHLTGKGVSIPFSIKDLREANREMLFKYAGILDNFSELEKLTDFKVDSVSFLKKVQETSSVTLPVIPSHLKEKISSIPDNINVKRR